MELLVITSESLGDVTSIELRWAICYPCALQQANNAEWLNCDNRA